MTAVHPDEVPILMYHSVAEDAAPLDYRFTVPPHRFAQHIEALADWGATTITVGQYAALLRSGAPMPARTVVLTVDDGYDDTAVRVLPLLAEAGFTATVFVTSGTIGTTVRDSRMISWDQVRELHEAGIEIGAHAHEHIALDIVPKSRARDEMVRSKAELEDGLGVPIPSFAFPHGHHTRRLSAIARDSGYSSASAAGDALSYPGADLYELPRILVTRTTTTDELIDRVEGRTVHVATSRRVLQRAAGRLCRRVVAMTSSESRAPRPVRPDQSPCATPHQVDG